MCVLLRGRELTIANVGDSRLIAAEMRGPDLVAVDLTLDQTPYRCTFNLLIAVAQWQILVGQACSDAASMARCTPAILVGPIDRAEHNTGTFAALGPHLLSWSCRKDELERVKAAGARVLTLEQLDGLRVRVLSDSLLQISQPRHAAAHQAAPNPEAHFSWTFWVESSMMYSPLPPPQDPSIQEWGKEEDEEEEDDGADASCLPCQLCRQVSIVSLQCFKLLLQDPSIQEWGTEEEDDGDPPRLWSPSGNFPGTAFTRSIGDSGALTSKTACQNVILCVWRLPDKTVA